MWVSNTALYLSLWLSLHVVSYKSLTPNPLGSLPVSTCWGFPHCEETLPYALMSPSPSPFPNKSLESLYHIFSPGTMDIHISPSYQHNNSCCILNDYSVLPNADRDGSAFVLTDLSTALSDFAPCLFPSVFWEHWHIIKKNPSFQGYKSIFLTYSRTIQSSP